MSKPVRVLYEIHPFTLGGTERFLARFLERLDRRRYEPLVISEKRGHPLELIRSQGVPTETMAEYFQASGIRRLADFIQHHGVELVQSNYYASTLAMAANLAGVPHVWRLGGHVEVGSGVRNREEAGWVLNLIRLLSKAIICNSKYVRSQFRGSQQTPPIQVIQNGIPATPWTRKKRERGAGLRVGMIAHLTPQKRHLDFIEAAEIVLQSRDDVSFTIVGSAYDNPDSRRYAAEVRRRARGLQQQGRLSLAEYYGPGDEVLGGFDVMVLPSVRESFSNAVLEAMAAGIPVIAARSGGHGELIEHRKTGYLVPAMRPEALARAVLRLAKDGADRDRMGQAARRRARTLFSMNRCVRAYEDIYARVISGQT